VLVGLRLMLRPILHLLISWRKWLRIARQVRLLLRFARRCITGLVLTHERLTVVLITVKSIIACLRLTALDVLLMRLLIVVGVLLAELLLRRGNQPEIMFGVLIVVLGGHGIAGSLRVTCKLDVFLSNVRGGAADFDVGTVRFIYTRERILAFAVIASPPHALLTISHDLPVCRPFTLSRHSRRTLNFTCKSNKSHCAAGPAYIRANDRNVVPFISIVAATPLPRSQPQRCQPFVTRIVLNFEK
jgi:hypothetical protein